MGAESERVGLAQASPPGGSCGVGPGYVCRALRAALEVSGARSSPGRGDSRARGRVLRRTRGLARRHVSPESGRLSPCTFFGTWLHPVRQRSEEHTSELQSRLHLVCRLLLEKNIYTT